jgi:hypothetical protein
MIRSATASIRSRKETTMPRVPGEPYGGTLIIDATALKDILFDLPPKAMQGLRSEQSGFDDVVKELATQVPAAGGAVGITAEMHTELVTLTDHLTKLREQRGDVAKLLEVIDESEAKYEDERESLISRMADSVRSTAKRTGNEAVLAQFEKLLHYNAQNALKAAKTRRRNAANAAAGEASAEPEVEPDAAKKPEPEPVK